MYLPSSLLFILLLLTLFVEVDACCNRHFLMFPTNPRAGGGFCQNFGQRSAAHTKVRGSYKRDSLYRFPLSHLGILRQTRYILQKFNVNYSSLSVPSQKTQSRIFCDSHDTLYSNKMAIYLHFVIISTHCYFFRMSLFCGKNETGIGRGTQHNQHE